MIIYDTVTTIVSRFINVVDPLRAARYVQQREFFKRAYIAAKSTTSDGLWKTPRTSGAQENVLAQDAVVARARDLARNNPYIVGARRRFRACTIGEGIWPRPKILKKKKAHRFDFEKETIEDILYRWEKWAPVAGANGDSIYQCQRVACNHFFDDGQVLIRKRMTRQYPFLQIEVLECDHLDKSKDREVGKNQNRIVGGIELDGFNRPLFYHLKTRHPSEVQSDTEKVPASEIIHLFDRQRASDVTGITGYASVVQSIFRLNEYAYSTMDAARLTNHFAVWIESPYVNEFGETVSGETGTSSDPQERYKHISPAAFHYGLPGEKPHTIRPENPGSQYDPFMTREIQTCSVGTGVSYEAMSHDGSRTNFAGSRQLQLLERAYSRISQSIFQEQMHAKIYAWFIETEVSFSEPGTPKLRMPDFDRDKQRYLRVAWNRPVQEWVDPQKDAKARQLRIQMNNSTETAEAEDMGLDIEEIYATKAYENEIKRKLGLPVMTPEQREEEEPRPALVQEEKEDAE